MTVMSNTQLHYKAFAVEINIKVNKKRPIDKDIDKAIATLRGTFKAYAIHYKRQGLIWLQEPHYDYTTRAIRGVFVIAKGITQVI